jgi:hypothetical protein
MSDKQLIPIQHNSVRACCRALESRAMNLNPGCYICSFVKESDTGLAEQLKKVEG